MVIVTVKGDNAGRISTIWEAALNVEILKVAEGFVLGGLVKLE